MGEALITRRGGGGSDDKAVKLKKVMDVVDFTPLTSKLEISQDVWRNVIESGKLYKICINVEDTLYKSRIELFRRCVVYASSGSLYLTHSGDASAICFAIVKSTGVSHQLSYGISTSSSQSKITITSNTGGGISLTSACQITLYEVEF